jgi:hypothetical protein
MTVAELESLFRNQLGDLLPDYFVSQALFIDYLNEAEEEAAFRKNLLFDKTSAFCTIPVSLTNSIYSLDSRIYVVCRADIVVTDTNWERLWPTDRIEMDRINRYWRIEHGTPRWFIQYDNTIELIPKPEKTYTLKLEVYRLPLRAMTTSSDVPEIQRNHHRSLVDWTLYRAFSSPDIDIQDMGRANDHLKKFTAIFGNRPSADNQRSNYANRPHRNKACTL